MKVKRRKIAYFEPSLQETFDQIAAIQTSVLGNAITSEQKYLHGFVDFSLTHEALVGLARIGLVKIAVSKRTSRTFGFGAAVPYSIANRIGYLEAIVKDVSSHFTYACFAHVCVQRDKSKSGLGSQLLRQLECIARAQNFEALIAPVPFQNEVGQIFFETRGFVPLVTPLVTDRLVLYKQL